MSTSGFLFWPYDEVTLRHLESRTAVEVESPWIKATITYREGDKIRIDSLLRKFQDESLSGEDLSLVNWFFQELSHYPFCYILPAPKDSNICDEHLRQNSDDISTYLAQFGFEDSIWDIDAALTFARAGDKIHPESFFSVARRFHLLDVAEHDEGKDKFAFIESLQADDFKQAASILVRQNHYVTQKCQEALLPALQTAGRSQKMVESFIKEENGHDLILGVAMKALNADPESVPVSLATKNLMELLKFAAGRNFLAFAIAIEFFERSSYEDKDPLAKLLERGGFDKAAKQINRHMEINDAGAHENVACTFLGPMALCDAEYAREALQIAEVISRVMNTITSSAVDLYHSSKSPQS